MRTLVKSLRRLYNQGRVTKEHIIELLDNGTITDSEYSYITGEVR